MNNLALKQTMWYLVGFILAYGISFLKLEKIYKHIWWIYGLGILSLILLLLFGTPINEAKCWFKIPGLGTIQPSEFVKIIIIITLSKMIYDFNKNHQNKTVLEEFVFLVKVGIIILIPSILTFLQPDTGVVFIYLLITITMLFIGGIRYRWFLIAITFLVLSIGTVVGVYFLNQDTFINIFGTDFFLELTDF